MGAGSNRHVGWTNTADGTGGIRLEAVVGNSTDPEHVFVPLTDTYASIEDVPLKVFKAWNAMLAGAATPTPSFPDSDILFPWLGVIVANFGEGVGSALQAAFNGRDADVLGLYDSAHAQYVAAKVSA